MDNLIPAVIVFVILGVVGAAITNHGRMRRDIYRSGSDRRKSDRGPHARYN